MAVSNEPLTPPPDIDTLPITDPPPPYPSRERRLRTSRRQTSLHTQSGSGDTDDTRTSQDEAEPNETTPFLPPGSRARSGRQRAHSFTSTLSAAPSLAHTVLSLFQAEDDVYLDEVGGGEHDRRQHEGDAGSVLSQRPGGFFSRVAWRRYFRPMTIRSYWRSLFHLTVVNFPYALLAWVYLFVFTVTGTTLLVALPLGAVLCFFDLLGARVFSRGELALQTRFHTPLAHPAPYPPRPIFTRYREPTAEEVELGQPTRQGLIREKSFYKNTYAMFTDSTSYQALFYFLVIKPAITLLVSISIIALVIPGIILVLPAPAMLRAVRKVGVWQANVAVEGLYHAVR